FAITGLTLNHQDFGLSDPKISRKTIELPTSLLENPEQESVSRHLQETLGIGTHATDYRDDDAEIQVIFAAPGKRTLVTIRRADRSAEVETETRGLLGKL